MERMRIGIDASVTTYNEKAGIGNYAFNLIKNLALIDKDNDYVLFYNFGLRGKGKVLGINQSNFTEKKIRIPNRILHPLWSKLNFPSIEVIIGEIDVFHSPSFILPPFKKARSIVTVHDLSFKFFPEDYPKDFCKYYEREVPLSARRADLVITDSKSSKDDIVRWLNIPENKIRVIYLAVDERFRKVKDELLLKEIEQKFNIDRKFILSVGTLQKRKNLLRLIEAFYDFMKIVQEDYILVFVGKQEYPLEEVSRIVQEYGLEKKIIFTNYVPDEDLPALYSSASLFVFPSLYEGFGMPILESMACGTPVITSNVSSMPEVAGDAAILVNPEGREELAYAMQKVLTNSSLRERMIKKGEEQVKLFSWKKTAEQTLAVYKEVHNK